MVPKMQSAMGRCMVWGVIWVGGRSDLVMFDCSERLGKGRA